MPCGLPMDCSTLYTAATHLCTTDPIIQELNHHGFPQTAVLPALLPQHEPLLMGCSSRGFAWVVASFKLHPLLHHGLLYGCTWRSALCGVHGLQGHSLLHHRSLLVCRELLLHTWSSFCTHSALTLLACSHLLSQLLLCSSVSLSSFCSHRGTAVAHRSALAVMGPFWSWLWSNMEQCWALLTEATPTSILIPKPCQVDPKLAYMSICFGVFGRDCVSLW